MINPYTNKKLPYHSFMRLASCGWVIVICTLLFSCSVSRVSIVNKKYPVSALKEDYNIFRGSLEEMHPSLYWFTPKSTMDEQFTEGLESITDSLTERQFRTLLTKVISSIRCGHTYVNYSARYSKYLDTADIKLFPLAFKVWDDTLAVTANLNKRFVTEARNRCYRNKRQTRKKADRHVFQLHHRRRVFGSWPVPGHELLWIIRCAV